MSGSLFIIFVSGMILLTIISVLKINVDRKQREDQELIRLNRNTTDLIMGFIWTALFIVWSAVFSYIALNVYQGLSEEYMDSFSQLFDIEYLSSLRLYFSENLMLSELSTIAYLENNFFMMLSWMIGTLCLSIIFIHRGLQKNKIYKNGILVNNKFVNWEKVNNYEWSKIYEKSLFKKNKYYELIVSLPEAKLWNSKNKVNLEVDYNNKERVENMLKKYN
ncbi:hypothetical protein [Isachenkonia alkalipeptolytica]|uniref:DUF5673 domain-containing protein n=1 Tax=Isachenkonia alkalipeptolytica TaxID=2565777 RepID=A0AA43XH44_9CLOT|nr:hypothetical protein [Isachenkonia alkalipeptolytica]NBG86875.1 hypothetical protein [Isachenkonia alkalipeptolytica]